MSETTTTSPEAPAAVTPQPPKKTTTVRHKKLCATGVETASGLEVTVTHVDVDSNAHVTYIVQPKGLTPDGRPIRAMYVSGARIPDVEEEETEMPIHVIGSQVTDKASGYVGTCTGLFYHLTGCVHLKVQAPGLDSKGNPIEAQDFDIRRCEGPELTPMTEEERLADQAERPSPSGSPLHHR